MSEVTNEVAEVDDDHPDIADLPDEDIGDPVDLDGDGIPDDLDVGDLDDLLSGVDPDVIEEPDDGEEEEKVEPSAHEVTG